MGVNGTGVFRNLKSEPDDEGKRNPGLITVIQKYPGFTGVVGIAIPISILQAKDLVIDVGGTLPPITDKNAAFRVDRQSECHPGNQTIRLRRIPKH